MSKNNSSQVNSNTQSVKQENINEQATEVENEMTEEEKGVHLLKMWEEIIGDNTNVNEFEARGYDKNYSVENDSNDKIIIVDKPTSHVISVKRIDDENNYPKDIYELSEDIKTGGYANQGFRKEEQDEGLVALVPVINEMQDQQSINTMLSDYVQECVDKNKSRNDGGATLVVGYVSAKDKTLTVRNLGDSRVVIVIEYYDEKTGISNVKSVLVTEDHDIHNNRIMEMLDEKERQETGRMDAKRDLDGSYLLEDKKEDEEKRYGVQTTSSIGDIPCKTNKIPDELTINLEKMVKTIFGKNAKLKNCKKIQVLACCDGVTEGFMKANIFKEEIDGYLHEKDMISYDYTMKTEKVEKEGGYEWKWKLNRDEISFAKAVGFLVGIKSKPEFETDIEISQKFPALKEATDQYYLVDGDIDALFSEIVRIFEVTELSGEAMIAAQENIKNSIFSDLIINLTHQEKVKHLIMGAIKKVVEIELKEEEEILEKEVKRCIKKRNLEGLLELIKDNPESIDKIKNEIFSKLADHVDLENLIINETFISLLKKWFDLKKLYRIPEGEVIAEEEAIIQEEAITKELIKTITQYYEERDFEKFTIQFLKILGEERNDELVLGFESFIFSVFTAMVNSNQIKIDDQIDISKLIVNHALYTLKSRDNIACVAATIDGSFFEKATMQEDSVDIIFSISDGHGMGGEEVSELCKITLQSKIYEMHNFFLAIRNKLDLIQELKIENQDLDYYIKIISEKLWDPKKDSYLASNNREEIEQGIYLVNQLKLLTFKKLCKDERNVNYDRSKNDIDMVIERLKKQEKLYAIVSLRKPSRNTMESINLIEKYSADLKTLQSQIRKRPSVLLCDKNVIGAVRLNSGVTKKRN